MSCPETQDPTEMPTRHGGSGGDDAIKAAKNDTSHVLA